MEHVCLSSSLHLICLYVCFLSHVCHTCIFVRLISEFPNSEKYPLLGAERSESANLATFHQCFITQDCVVVLFCLCYHHVFSYVLSDRLVSEPPNSEKHL